MLNSRLEEILKVVNRQRKVAVTELARQLRVSVVTVRKDLTTLEDQGLLRRQHGFAVVNNPDNLNYRLAQHYEAKSRIARAAADLVADGATIMIESGSACALLAATLGEQGKHVTIVTNSYYIADYVANYPTLAVFVLGGRYQGTAQVVVGPLTQQMLTAFHVAQLFVGTDGYDHANGFSSRDIMRNEVAQAMARRAETVTVLTDSSKFQGASLMHQFALNEVDRVITDDSLSDAVARDLRAQTTLQLV
ncbi:DeoR/GlpR family DNA-binding transcription regulator [Levilactobacillus spicheri]|nr:DeoR/GlpR family DNA-binding transcription regulator [Levilactobacillus spicheri]